MQGLPFPMHCASTPLTMRFCAACSGSYKAICTHTDTHTQTHAHKSTHNDAQTRAHVSTFTSIKNAETQGQIHSLTDNSALTRTRMHTLITHMHSHASACTPIEKHVSMSSRFNKPPNAHPHLWHSSARRLTLRCHNVAQVWTNTSMNFALNYATGCTHRDTHAGRHFATSTCNLHVQANMEKTKNM